MGSRRVGPDFGGGGAVIVVIVVDVVVVVVVDASGWFTGTRALQPLRVRSIHHPHPPGARLCTPHYPPASRP
jgi:hypothetical protein